MSRIQRRKESRINKVKRSTSKEILRKILLALLALILFGGAILLALLPAFL
jgi:hypothetical protein